MVAIINLLKRAGNEAVQINPATESDINITEHGSDWYWTVFSLFGLFFLAYFAIAFIWKKANDRFYFVVAGFDLFFLTIGYFTLASNLGNAGAPVEFNHIESEFGIRQIFYAKYIAWFLSFPLLLLNYGVFAAVEWPTLLSTIVGQWVFILGILFGSLISSTYKWGYYVFGLVGLFYVWSNLLTSFVSSATAADSSNRRFAWIYSIGIAFIQLLYPIAWGLSEGGNVIKPDSEGVFYGILDIVIFIILQSYFLFYTRDTDFSKLGINTANHPVFHSSEKFAYPASPQITGITAVQNQSSSLDGNLAAAHDPAYPVAAASAVDTAVPAAANPQSAEA